MKQNQVFKRRVLIAVLAVSLCLVGLLYWGFSQSEDYYPYTLRVRSKSPLVSMSLNGKSILDQLEVKEVEGVSEYSIPFPDQKNGNWLEVSISCRNKEGNAIDLTSNTWKGRSEIQLTLGDIIKP